MFFRTPLFFTSPEDFNFVSIFTVLQVSYSIVCKECLLMTGATSLMHIGNKIYAAGSALIRFVFFCKMAMQCIVRKLFQVFTKPSFSHRFLFVKNSMSSNHQYYKKDQFIIKCILVPQVYRVIYEYYLKFKKRSLIISIVLQVAILIHVLMMVQ